MNATQMIEMMNQQPFEPLEIRLNNGTVIKVDEPFLIATTRNSPSVHIFEEDEDGQPVTRRVAYRNIAEVVTRVATEE